MSNAEREQRERRLDHSRQRGRKCWSYTSEKRPVTDSLPVPRSIAVDECASLSLWRSLWLCLGDTFFFSTRVFVVHRGLFFCGSYSSYHLRVKRMIIQTKSNTGECHAAPHAVSVDDTAGVEHHNPESEPEDDRTEHNQQKTSTSTKKAAATQTTTPLSTKSPMTIQKTSKNRGSTTLREQRTKRTTCKQQAESPRGDRRQSQT